MDILRSLKLAGSGMAANRQWMDTISSNLANARATQTPEGGPYKRRDPVFVAEDLGGNDTMSVDSSNARMGVRVAGVRIDESTPVLLHEPGHPDADKDGMVKYPNISAVEEMTNMITASRSYEANVQAFNSFKTMATRALDLFR